MSVADSLIAVVSGEAGFSANLSLLSRRLFVIARVRLQEGSLLCQGVLVSLVVASVAVTGLARRVCWYGCSATHLFADVLSVVHDVSGDPGVRGGIPACPGALKVNLFFYYFDSFPVRDM